MQRSVLITGVTGSGKSTVCHALRGIGCDAVDLEAIDGLYELIEDKTGEVLSRDVALVGEHTSWNCQKSKLKKLLNSQTAELTFYCGGMSNTEEVWDLFDHVVVLTVSDEITATRLSTRHEGEFGYTPESRDWVLSWKHDIEKRWLKMGGIEVNAEASPETVAKTISHLFGQLDSGLRLVAGHGQKQTPACLKQPASSK